MAPLASPLRERHLGLGARLIDFAGWEMPLQYGGILEEHRAVRERAGLFDLSHMGELEIAGPGAAAGLTAALVTDPAAMAVGRAGYSLICTEDGGIIDDLIVYRLADDRFLVVPNAANRIPVAAALRERLRPFDATVDDASLRTGLVAIQGPAAAAILGPLTEPDPTGLRNYAAARATVAGVPALVARTGYTGEDGFELFVAWERTAELWDRLLAASRDHGAVPAGLGARDTLRLEAGMPLYGNELDRSTNPFEAGLGRFVKLDKPADFTGRRALERALAEGQSRTLVGLVVTGRGIARHGYPVLAPNGTGPAVPRPRPDARGAIGQVTSGTTSPTLGVPIAMAYVPPALSAPGTMLAVDVRGAPVPAEVVPLPFYRRPR